jgi:phosphoribosylglycinamide formyltransferase-1
MSPPPLPIGVLISGGGSTLENLIARLDDGRLSGVRIAQVISSRRAVRGVQIALDAELPTAIIRPRDYPTATAFDEALAATLDSAACELAVMAGFLVLWRFPDRYSGRVLNIHPALLPDFGGPGLYGRRVHEAVLAAGRHESGCTVHLADHQFDHGPILAQQRVPVLPGDTPDSLAQRVAAAERELYPRVLAEVAQRGPAWLAGLARSER